MTESFDYSDVADGIQELPTLRVDPTVLTTEKLRSIFDRHVESASATVIIDYGHGDSDVQTPDQLRKLRDGTGIEDENPRRLALEREFAFQGWQGARAVTIVQSTPPARV